MKIQGSGYSSRYFQIYIGVNLKIWGANVSSLCTVPNIHKDYITRTYDGDLVCLGLIAYQLTPRLMN